MRNWYSASALIVLAVLFLGLTMLSGTALKGFRIDLTEHRLYTLSDGTRNLLANLDEPITLHFFFSEDTSGDFPMVRNFARRVQELLDEMAARSGGNLQVRRIDPRPFSEEEDQAARFGLEAVPLARGTDSLYMGIAGTNLIDGLEVIPFLSPAREEFLEYDLARMIYVLSLPDRPRVGILTKLPLDGGFDFRTGQRQPAWAVYDQISQLFDVELLEPDIDVLPAPLDVLVLIHPDEFSEELDYAVDQFMLGGGRVLAFIDPFSETDPVTAADDPTAALTADRSSYMPPSFAAWGLEMEPDRFVADLGLALQVNVEPGRPTRHPGIIGIDRRHLAADDVVTGDLETINVSSAGAFSLSADSALVFEPLLTSSDRAGLLDADRLRFLGDPSELVAEATPTGERYVIAARISGEADTAFPDRNGDDHLASGLVNAIVVADADLLADRFWVQRQQFFGSTILNPFADNGSFAINAIDHLIGNADLISVRSRATSARPFDLVNDLRREAERNLRATEQRLEGELAETERRLTELQQARGDTDLSVLTPEQEAEIDRFMSQRLEIRQQLRQVRRDLDRDIEALGNRLKIINIALVPALVTLFALWLAWRRHRALKEAKR